MAALFSEIEGIKVLYEGAVVGELRDLVVKENGDVIALAIKLTGKNKMLQFLPRDSQGNLLLPASVAVLRGDAIVINKDRLRILIAKRSVVAPEKRSATTGEQVVH